MKAIKDCVWEVEIRGVYASGRRLWYAKFENEFGFGDFQSKPLDIAIEAKHNWEHFAKINKIKKWRYV